MSVRVVHGAPRHMKAWKKSPVWSMPPVSAAPDGDAPLPEVDSMRQWVSRYYDQGPIGTCGPNAWVAGSRLLRAVRGLPEPDLSRLGLYYDYRDSMGISPTDDSGVMIGPLFRVASQGVGNESLMPYSTDIAAKPSAEYEADRPNHRALMFVATPTLSTIRRSIADRYPVQIGFQVFKGFESEQVARTGVIPEPDPGEQTDEGHSVLIIGRKPGFLEVLNSYGHDFGDAGCLWLPEDYITNGWADDCISFRSEAV